MKEEYQTIIDSICECLPMQNVLMDNELDPLRNEMMSTGSVMFTESQCSIQNFVASFITQADISRLSSDCDLVPQVLQ